MFSKFTRSTVSLQRVEGGYMPVNNEYKPVGFYRDVYVDYDDFQEHILPIQITPVQAKRLARNECDDTTMIDLYTGCCRPFRHGAGTDKASADYQRRLSILDGLLQKVLSKAA